METNRVLKLLLYKIDSRYFQFMKITEEGSTICKIINMIQDIDRVIYNSFASQTHGINKHWAKYFLRINYATK